MTSITFKDISDEWGVIEVNFDRKSFPPIPSLQKVFSDEKDPFLACGGAALVTCAHAADCIRRVRIAIQHFLNIAANADSDAFPYHRISGKVFNSDPKFLIRAKCLGLVVLTPLISVIRSVYWAVKAFFMCFNTSSHSDKNSDRLQTVAYDAIRALGYGLYMTQVACSGILYPHEARLRYGAFERTLNRQESPHRNKFYLAICFQPIYTINEDNKKDVEKRLLDYSQKIDNIERAFLSGNCRQLVAIQLAQVHDIS